MDIKEIRRANLRNLAARSSWKDLAKKLEKPPSYLSQIAGPNPSRPLNEKSARKFEVKLSLPEGFFDIPSEDNFESRTVNTRHVAEFKSPYQTKPNDLPLEAQESGQIVKDVIWLIDATITQEGIQIEPMKYASLVQLALADAIEHYGHARISHVQSMIRLLK